MNDEDKGHIWNKFHEIENLIYNNQNELKELLNQNETISAKTAAQASKKTSEYRNKAEASYTEAASSLDNIKKALSDSEEIRADLQMKSDVMKKLFDDQIEMKEQIEAISNEMTEKGDNVVVN